MFTIVTLTVIFIFFLSNNFIRLYRDKYINNQSYKAILSNYDSLHTELKSKKFDEANLHTVNIIRYLTNTGKHEAISLENLSCNHLANLNKYWSEYSDNQYGFSTQKKIWKEKENVKEFVKKLGWENTCGASVDTRSTDFPEGHFPKCIFINTDNQVKSFMSKLEQCNI